MEIIRLSVLSVAFALFCGVGCASAKHEEDQPLVQYKAYLQALRAENAEDILKLSVPVSQPVKPIQLEAIKGRILMERLRRQTIAQLGPIDFKKDDTWWGIGEWWDAYLDDVKIERDKDMIGLGIRNPDPTLRREAGHDLPIAFFVHHNGNVLLPIGLDMNIDTADEKGAWFTEPEPDERERVLKHFQIVNKALKAVLNRLARKEFQNSMEVRKALDGEIPQGESLLHY
jgi:hypothetical protein